MKLQLTKASREPIIIDTRNPWFALNILTIENINAAKRNLFRKTVMEGIGFILDILVYVIK